MQKKSLGFSAALFALAALTLVAFMPDVAHAAALHAPVINHGSIHSFLVEATVTLAGLRSAHQDLVTRAEAKQAEIKDGMPAADATRIEGEHAELVRQIEVSRTAIATREREEAEAAARAVSGQGADVQVRAERERSATITDIGHRAGFAHDVVATAINDGTSVEMFRSRAFDHLAAQDARKPTDASARASLVGQTDEEKRGAAMEEAILHRFDPGSYKLTDHGREYRGMSLIEMGRDLLHARNVKTRGMSKTELATTLCNMRSEGSYAVRSGGMMSTSDFPNVLANIANKTLRAGYAAAPQTFRPLVRVVSVPDFKQVARVQLGEAPQLEKVNEHGEFRRGKMGDAAERYSVATYGKVIAITRQVLVNDDLDAFTRVPRAFGVAAANLESDLVWAQIAGNPVMGDGNTLFHAAHKNIGTAGAISTASVGALRKLMRIQTGLDGKTLLNIAPAYIIVPTELETLVEQFLSQIYAAKTADVVTESMKKLKPISDPRLDAVSTSNWYLAGDVGQIDLVELAYLEGQEGLYTETRMGFDVDGVEVKARQDVGAKVIDFRGFAKNPN